MSKDKDKQTKAEKFKRVAEGRVSRALKSLELVGNLANRAAYEYDDMQVSMIERALGGALANLFAKFAEPPPKEQPSFTFDGSPETEDYDEQGNVVKAIA